MSCSNDHECVCTIWSTVPNMCTHLHNYSHIAGDALLKLHDDCVNRLEHFLRNNHPSLRNTQRRFWGEALLEETSTPDGKVVLGLGDVTFWHPRSPSWPYAVSAASYCPQAFMKCA